MRTKPEVLIYVILVSLSLLIWLFFPLWYLESVNYEQYLTPIGFEIHFFNKSAYLILPLTISAIGFFIFSAIIPLVWKSCRYSLYTSTLASALGISNIISSLIYQQRYLSFHDYHVLPTPNGAFYIYFPSTQSFSFPFYLLILSLIVSGVNSLTRASWLPVQRLSLIDKILNDIYDRGLIKALSKYLDDFGVYFAVEKNSIKTGNLVVGSSETLEIDPFFPSYETAIIGEKYVTIITRDGDVKYLDLVNGVKTVLGKLIENSEIKKKTKDLYL